MRRNYLHRRSYKPLLRRAGLPDIRLYELKHTFATLMFENREQLRLVSEMPGHISVQQTSGTYTHTSPPLRSARPLCASAISSRGAYDNCLPQHPIVVEIRVLNSALRATATLELRVLPGNS
jgi:hypothetical protein